LGVNVGANKISQAPIDDYRRAVGHLARYADYITLNISSPNTPGLRNLQTKAHLADLLAAGRAGLDETAGDGDVPTKPIFLKIAPDLHHDDLVVIVESCVEAGVSGIIATNTTLARPDDLDGVHASESGGLSGAPLFEAATAILADVARLSDRRLGLIGAGGVANGWLRHEPVFWGLMLVQIKSAKLQLMIIAARLGI
jgi:dihydroorotate dehydrogenase